MTEREAKEIIAKVASGEILLSFEKDHFKERLQQRSYSQLDVLHLLKNHSLEAGPEYQEEFGMHRVTLRGRTLDGRDTRLVLDIHVLDDAVCVSIMTIGQSGGGKR